MKKIVLLLLTALLAMPFAFGKELHRKEVITITPTKGDTIVLSCIYGNITVEHWNKPTAEITLEATAETRKSSDAQAILDAIKFSSIGRQRITGAKVEFKNKKNIVLGKNNERWEINLTIKAPKKFPMRLKNQFGNIYGDDFEAPLTINCSYGKINIGNVRNASLELSFCSDCAVGSAKNIALANKYSTIKIGSADTLRASDQFGKINIGKLEAAGLGLSYSQFVSTDIIRSLRANSAFSKIKITRLAPDFRLVDVEGQYSDLKIGINNKAAFEVITENMKYGKCKIKGLKTKVVLPEEEELGYDSSRRKKSDREQLLINGGGKGRIQFNGGNFSEITIHAITEPEEP